MHVVCDNGMTTSIFFPNIWITVQSRDNGKKQVRDLIPLPRVI